MSEVSLINQPQGLMDTFLLQMSEGSGNLNQLLAFMSLSNTMTALNLISVSEQKTSGSGSIDALFKGADTQGLQSVIGNMLGQGGNKLNLTDLVGMLGSAMGQQGQGQGQGKLNPQLLLSLLSMFSQMDNKKKATPIEAKEEEAEEEKVKENSKDKQHQDKK